ncbi:MAG: serine/threonine protein kinase [Desulfobacteraceae bacterium 4572_88]|nr:MAG: serine/threonine protein kinase [Desulfobacteraceae bacterium 4572_88]
MGFLKKYPAICWGVAITILFLSLGYFRWDFVDTLERKLYDVRMGMRSDPAGQDSIVIVDIDDESIDKLGRWPWPRSRIAEGIRKISAEEPKVIGLNIIYTEPQDSESLRELKYLTEELTRIRREQVESQGTAPEFLFETIQAIRESRKKLDNDSKLAQAIEESGKVVLPVYFKESFAARKPKDKADALQANAIQHIEDKETLICPRGGEAVMPIPEFLNHSIGVGHVNLAYDIDGKVRWEQLLYEYQGHYIPSFTLRLAALSLDVSNEDIEVFAGDSISLGYLNIPTNQTSELLVNFKGPSETFRRYSFFDVINDKYQDKLFKDKIVLIAPSASGIMNPVSTPLQAMSVGEFSANVIWAMRNRQFVQKPSWSFLAELAAIVFLGLVITFVLPRLKALLSGLLFILLLTIIFAVSWLLFTSQGLWIGVTYPLLQLLVGYLGVVTIRYFMTETHKQKIEEESAESNRMLGLSFQSQGQLDMAFDKFRGIPVDDKMKDILYNLALDFERKRQLNKAATVYEYIEGYDAEYKDVGQRKRKLIQASETMVFGGDTILGAATSREDPLMTIADGVRPTLGRYEVIRQLGKGAMGIVYLGQDPRINRTTAIKTFRFSDDFEADEIENMKRKFFREAESAGTLSHPNIVTIYDAGDENDLAYIAMEFLEGDDLQKYTKKSNLLPMRKVLDYIADIADALDYAHAKGIVHRDIKPANIMLLKKGMVKITDFGIARITASSQTQTGVVKGTPHYMSPEQISGEKVDGRSDIFSLGAMLFQLLTGDVPFHGNSPAALLHQILNVRHPDPRKLNPRLLKPHVAIIDKSMEKDRKKRYQKASHMASHLRMLGKKIDDALKNKR